MKLMTRKLRTTHPWVNVASAQKLSVFWSIVVSAVAISKVVVSMFLADPLISFSTSSADQGVLNYGWICTATNDL